MSEEIDTECEFKFTWKIVNFYLSPQKIGECIVSPEFTVENLHHSTWNLSLIPRAIEGNESYLYLELMNCVSAVKIISVDIKIEVIDAQDKIILVTENSVELKKDCNFYCGKFKCISKFHDDIKYSHTDSLTIRCYVMRQVSRKFTECSAVTKINFDRASFKWQIEEFNSSNYYICRQFPSYFYDFQAKIGISVCESEDDFKFTIRKLKKGNKEYRVLICEIVVLGVDGAKEIWKRDIHWYDGDDMVWEFPTFMKKSVLMTNIGKYVKDNTLMLMCDFFISSERMSTEICYDQSHCVRADTPVEAGLTHVLKEDFKCMLTNNIQSDIKLQIENELYPAHRCVLSARSPVFRTMFEQDMVENQTGVVKIIDLDANTLHSFLVFLYTGEANNLDADSASKLLLAAEKYEVESLKDKCSSILMSALTDGNVCQILSLADMVGHETLKMSAFNFIKSHSSVILSSAEWEECITHNIRLGTQIIRQLSANLANPS